MTEKSTRQLAIEYGVSRTTIENRLRDGWRPGEPMPFGKKQVAFMQKRIATKVRPADPVAEALKKWPRPVAAP